MAIIKSIQQLDNFLINPPLINNLSGFKRFIVEFLFFGVKQARACLFPALILLALLIIPKTGIAGIPRYDILLAYAILVQIGMLYFKLETWDEFKTICLFHVLGFALEAFKISDGIQSWAYPDFAYSKVLGVPLFTGFMYASIASYIIQTWRLLDLKMIRLPDIRLMFLAAFLVYANFFTHHFIGDYRYYILVFIILIYWKSWVAYKPYDTYRHMPLLLGFILVGFFIWIAENIGTFAGIWQYPNQKNGWSLVHLGKWNSWSLLYIMSF
ncbi:MAG: DUF817 domain-containing protein, partial [Neisseriaceae bacterium]|nr:DUF817 domain-containing protein [Neisseriaceae bacterium]